MKVIVTADRSREAARHLRLPLWRWCVRVLVALFVVGNAIDWFATIFVLGIVISNWTLIIGDLISGEAGLTDVAWIAGTLTLTVLAIWIVAAVVSADKRTVLYLRRFHAHGPQARMRGTLDSGLGRRYRVVALYDGLFQPLEVPPLERWLNRIVLPLVAVALVLGSSLFVYLAPLVSLGAPMIIGPIVVGFLLLRYRVRRRARIAVATRRDLATCVTRVARLKRWWTRPSSLAPQATVVTVPDELWQEAVAELSRSVDALVVDISSVSVNLLWELERLSASGFRRCVLIAEQDLLRQWSASHTDPGAERCRALLSDQLVLVYAGIDRSSRRQFSRSLARLLDRAVTDQWPVRPRDAGTAAHAPAIGGTGGR